MKPAEKLLGSTLYPGLHQTGRRIIVHLCIYTCLFAILCITASLISGHLLHAATIKWIILISIILAVAVETLWEAIYILSQYKFSLKKKELMQQLNMEQEFEHLKNQVNPHFLFNCFNTLSSLISDDREKAETFLDELSKVYRYLLTANTDGVSTVLSEVSFIQSYLQLLKTRHGDALQVQIQVDRNYNSFLLPSLSLQLLVENAVKHNIVSRHQPLTIEIFTTPANQLIVNNNLQRKTEKIRSTKIGLNNIRSKYQLLHEDGFQVVEGEKNFMAVMPLIKNKPAV